jgi:probable F420-dependent oxidoreductase
MKLGVAIGNLGFAMAGSIDPIEHARRCCRVAIEAEQHGFDSVWVGDHLALPIVASTPYPYGRGGMLDPRASMLDPFAVHAALSAQTERIRLGFGVAVLPYRPALVTAKLVATIDALSAGRVVLGVGAGWLPEEFAALGVDFPSRAMTTDSALRYLLRVFEEGEADGMIVLPMTVQRPHPPIWVGGNGPQAMRRAIELGDGWDAPYADPLHLTPALARLGALCDEFDRDPATLGVSVRGIEAGAVDLDLIGNYESLGVTELAVILPMGDQTKALEVMASLAERCASHLA